MYQQFKARAEGVGAEVTRFATNAGALDYVVRFLQNEGLTDAPQSTALWDDCPFLAQVDRQRLAGLSGLSFEVTRERAAEAKFGISQMSWALANTGTLAQDASRVASRLVSSLSSIHIAIVPTGSLLPDLPTLLTTVDPASMGYIALITGASRTADIERVLTIGVHGPERLIIVFSDELGGAN